MFGLFFSLGGNNIENEGAQMIALVLTTNTTLTYLGYVLVYSVFFSGFLIGGILFY